MTRRPLDSPTRSALLAGAALLFTAGLAAGCAAHQSGDDQADQDQTPVASDSERADGETVDDELAVESSPGDDTNPAFDPTAEADPSPEIEPTAGTDTSQDIEPTAESAAGATVDPLPEPQALEADDLALDDRGILGCVQIETALISLDIGDGAVLDDAIDQAIQLGTASTVAKINSVAESLAALSTTELLESGDTAPLLEALTACTELGYGI